MSLCSPRVPDKNEEDSAISPQIPIKKSKFSIVGVPGLLQKYEIEIESPLR